MKTTGPTLVVFTRYPVPGRTKTRLAGVLGPQGAADLHRRLAEHALRQAREAASRIGLRLEVHHTSGDEVMADWLGDDLVYRPQTDGDLGARMAAALAAVPAPAIVMGTDCPDLDAAILVTAFAALSDHDLVLGPATDGGYYLIGLTEPRPTLFRDIVWGSDQVARQTLEIASRHDLRVALLTSLADVDRPGDLERIKQFLPPRSAMG